MKVGFHSNQLCMRGAEVALYDYALFNREFLGNSSVIISSKALDLSALPKFQKAFEVYLYDRFSEVESWVENQAIDAMYFIKAGVDDGKVVKSAKNLVHAVFQACEPHGDVYAYISEWLAEKTGNGKHPFVPHMINLPDHDKDYRELMGIGRESIVFGRYGGEDQFNIPFVHKVVYEAAKANPNIYFLFMNTDRFCEPIKNIIHISPTYDLSAKVGFINTCDAMIHARIQGESFGLAIAEFLWRDKPVITCSAGVDLNHVAMLGDQGTYYENARQLWNILTNFEKTERDGKYRALVERYAPENVMKKFESVFLN